MENGLINKATIELVKEFEGLRLKAYRDSAGVLTIGYGTTAAAGLGITPKAGMVITEAEAEGYLIKGLEKFAASIRPKITAPINDNEFGAFLSLAYNIGPWAFAKSSALRKFNAGDKAGAANAILLWNKAGGKVLAGLTRRRGRERELFLTPIDQNPIKKPYVKETPEIEHKTPPNVKNPGKIEHEAAANQNPIKKPGLLALIFAALLALFRK
jgi:lysozyme